MENCAKISDKISQCDIGFLDKFWEDGKEDVFFQIHNGLDLKLSPIIDDQFRQNIFDSAWDCDR